MLHIPTVSEDDLNGFHQRHFSSVPTQVFSNAYSIPSSAPIPKNIGDSWNEEDDGLGHYEDGAKRTLTDEQVTMFRHSEVQTLLREARLRQERAESTGGSASSEDELQADMSGDDQQGEVDGAGDNSDEREYENFLRKEKRNLLDTKAMQSPDFGAGLQEVPTSPKLDYGDGPSAVMDRPGATQTSDATEGRTRIFYGDAEDFQSPSFSALRGGLPQTESGRVEPTVAKEKKFLWPKIG